MQCSDCGGTGNTDSRTPCLTCNGTGNLCDVCGEACDEPGEDTCEACKAEADPED